MVNQSTQIHDYKWLDTVLSSWLNEFTGVTKAAPIFHPITQAAASQDNRHSAIGLEVQLLIKLKPLEKCIAPKLWQSVRAQLGTRIRKWERLVLTLQSTHKVSPLCLVQTLYTPPQGHQRWLYKGIGPFLCAYICLSDEETMLEQGARVAKGQKECQRGSALRLLPLVAPFLIHDFMGENFPAFPLCLYRSKACFPACLRVWLVLAWGGGNQGLHRCNSPRKWEAELLAQEASDFKGNFVMWAKQPSNNKARICILKSQPKILNPLAGPQRITTKSVGLGLK